MEIQFKTGDKVRRKAGNIDGWWTDICHAHKVEPDAIFEVYEHLNDGGVILKELGRGSKYAENFFELVKDAKESEIEKAYTHAKSLIGKKIVCDDGPSKYTVSGVIFRQDKTDNVGLGHTCEKFLRDNGWVVGVRFNNMNYPVQLVNEVPSNISVELINGSYTAVVSKGSVKVGCQTFPIEKIQEIIEAHNKL